MYLYYEVVVCGYDLSLTCPPVAVWMESPGVAAIIRLTRLDASCRSVDVVGVAMGCDRIDRSVVLFFASTCYV